jgi:uncharacterized metal-binding protein
MTKIKVYQGGDESVCNPIFQAMPPNEEKRDFNVPPGLCAGHDSLFSKHADAYNHRPGDKRSRDGHNPLAAIYLHNTYYPRPVSAPTTGDDSSKPLK